jgi:hypothetical protein
VPNQRSRFLATRFVAYNRRNHLKWNAHFDQKARDRAPEIVRCKLVDG